MRRDEAMLDLLSERGFMPYNTFAKKNRPACRQNRYPYLNAYTSASCELTYAGTYNITKQKRTSMCTSALETTAL